MPTSDNQNANWRYGGGDLLADDIARLSLAPDNSQVDSHSRNASSGAGRSSMLPDVSSDPTKGLHGKDQPSYPSLANVQRGAQKPQGPPANGRGRGFGARNTNFRPPQQLNVGIPGQAPSPTSLGYALGTPQPYDIMGLSEQRVPPNTGIRPNQVNGSDSDSQAMQGFPSMFNPGLSALYNQFYPNQDAYRADLAAQAQAMLVARLQQQQFGQYPGTPPATGSTEGASMTSPASATSSTGNGPSANNRKLGLYKTELCRSWEEKNTCRYGAKCQFAHGEQELRSVQRHPKYKTEICRTFWVSGSCPYGKRCCFIHTELPNGANPNGIPGPPSAGLEPLSPAGDNRPRSESNTSDPEAKQSLLERISVANGTGQKATESGTPTPVESTSASNFSRPSLTLSTNLDNKAFQQTKNKSAYPFLPNAAGRGSFQPAPEPATAKSPIPVTAGPDFGRHTASRIEIVGHNTRNGASTPTGGHSYSNSIDEGSSHQRTTSNGAWRLASPIGEANISSPWTTQELATGGRSQRPW